ncbi:hypothetical protein PORY_001052 [Pneumocystis oryctolagi]|uniref:Uncharacterized protein n=1 Tax=Pneumocystis oryctolagi TaxID=42067 RepID=A0ACB7CCY4_9ASCO|nr:hypothetical protein PORY_001052 [Pneumocystis oryctolagi]
MTERKSLWVPIECDPLILTQYLWELGISKDLKFYEIFSLDDSYISEFVSRPVYSLVFVFPVIELNKNDNLGPKTLFIKNNQNILWCKQTINNSCGTIALLHASCNGDARNFIVPGSLLSNILNEIQDLDIFSRSKFIESSLQLEAIHAKFASQGTTLVQNSSDDIPFHYICITKSSKDGHLYELDGRNPLGPIDHGILKDNDLLGDQSIQIIKKYIDRRKNEFRFSLCALAPVLY